MDYDSVLGAWRYSLCTRSWITYQRKNLGKDILLSTDISFISKISLSYFLTSLWYTNQKNMRISKKNMQFSFLIFKQPVFSHFVRRKYSFIYKYRALTSITYPWIWKSKKTDDTDDTSVNRQISSKPSDRSNDGRSSFVFALWRHL